MMKNIHSSCLNNILTFACVSLVAAYVVSATSYFVHFSDPHLDFKYRENASVNCALMGFGFPCCHDFIQNLTPHERAPMYGHRFCDIPRETFESIVEAMAKEYPTPAFVLLTGDLVSHDALYEYPEHLAQKWDFTFTTVKKYFGENIKIISTIGNHDVFPADQVSDNKTDDGITALLNVMYKHGVLHQGVPDEDAFSLRGYYKTSIPNSNVDCVVMNNIIDLTRNAATDKNNRDPGGMYSWMQRVIAESAAAKRKVWLIGHVAPGIDMQLQRGVSLIERLVDTYARNGTITAAFYGHTHLDEFVLTGMESLYDKAEFVSIFAPGMTSKGSINPSARAVDIEGDDLTLVDWHQYRMNLNASNKERQLIFKHVYDFRDFWDVPDMSPKSFQSIAQKVLKDQRYALRYLRTRRTRDDEYDSCDEDCRHSTYCLISFRESATLNASCFNTSYEDLLKTIQN